MNTCIWKPLLAGASITGMWSAATGILEGMMVAIACAACALFAYAFERLGTIERIRRTLVLVGCLALLSFVAFVDFTTGYNLSVLVLYYVPIGLCAWYLSPIHAYVFAGLSTVAWAAVHFATPHQITSQIILWNSSMRVISFALVAWSVARERQHRARESALLNQLGLTRGSLARGSAMSAA